MVLRELGESLTLLPQWIILATWSGLYNLCKLAANFAHGELHLDWSDKSDRGSSYTQLWISGAEQADISSSNVEVWSKLVTKCRICDYVIIFTETNGERKCQS